MALCQPNLSEQYGAELIARPSHRRDEVFSQCHNNAQISWYIPGTSYEHVRQIERKGTVPLCNTKNSRPGTARHPTHQSKTNSCSTRYVLQRVYAPVRAAPPQRLPSLPPPRAAAGRPAPSAGSRVLLLPLAAPVPRSQIKTQAARRNTEPHARHTRGVIFRAQGQAYSKRHGYRHFRDKKRTGLPTCRAILTRQLPAQRGRPGWYTCIHVHGKPQRTCSETARYLAHAQHTSDFREHEAGDQRY